MKTSLFSALLLVAAFVHAEPERLISLRGTYAEQLSKIDTEHLAATTTLQAQYASALGEMEVTFRKQGNLASLIKITSEKERFSKAGVVETEHIVSEVPEISALQRRFVAEIEAATLKTKEQQITLAQFYERSLAKLEKELTRKNEIADALKVMEERDHVATARKALVAATTPRSDTAGAGRPSTQPPMQEPGNRLPPGLAADLVLYHAFNSVKDNVVQDQSGRGGHGVLRGVTFVADGRGKGNGALQFDGSGAHVALENVLKDVDAPMSFACWVNIHAFANSWESHHLIMSHVTPTKQSGIHAGFKVSYNPHRFFGFNLGDGKGISSGNRMSFMSAQTKTLNEWVHLTITVSKKLDVTFYLNGKLAPDPVKTAGQGTSIGHTDEPAAIGFRFNGMLDDVMVWKRCLDDAEVQHLYTLTGGN